MLTLRTAASAMGLESKFTSPLTAMRTPLRFLQTDLPRKPIPRWHDVEEAAREFERVFNDEMFMVSFDGEELARAQAIISEKGSPLRSDDCQALAFLIWHWLLQAARFYRKPVNSGDPQAVALEYPESIFLMMLDDPDFNQPVTFSSSLAVHSKIGPHYSLPSAVARCAVDLAWYLSEDAPLAIPGGPMPPNLLEQAELFSFVMGRLLGYSDAQWEQLEYLMSLISRFDENEAWNRLVPSILSTLGPWSPPTDLKIPEFSFNLDSALAELGACERSQEWTELLDVGRLALGKRALPLQDKRSEVVLPFLTSVLKSRSLYESDFRLTRMLFEVLASNPRVIAVLTLGLRDKLYAQFNIRLPVDFLLNSALYMPIIRRVNALSTDEFQAHTQQREIDIKLKLIIELNLLLIEILEGHVKTWLPKLTKPDAVVLLYVAIAEACVTAGVFRTAHAFMQKISSGQLRTLFSQDRDWAWVVMNLRVQLRREFEELKTQLP